MPLLTRFKSLFHKGASPAEDGQSRPKAAPGSPEGVGGTVLSPRSPELTALQMAEQQDWEVKDLKGWKKGDVILDTYRVEDIKAGGMGVVYIAEHQGWRVNMAIKSPNQRMLSNRSFYARVLRESEEWIRLGLHPHIAYCYYVRKIEEVPHIFIEYVNGGNLREWIAEARCYDLKVGLDLAIQFCHGMEYAHKHGMIAHRDIKPENILMTKEGLLKVTDFGIARFQGTEEGGDRGQRSEARGQDAGAGGSPLTVFGTRMGKLDYMSPEQWEDPHGVDIRADVFSFGVCLYEMFCGTKPYGSASEVAASVVAQSEGKEAPDPVELRRDMPGGLAQMLRRCCALEPKDRYASLEELGDALKGVYRDLFGEEAPHAQVRDVVGLADGLNNRAVSFLELGREEEAMPLLDQALEVEPMHLEATYNRGLLDWRRGRINDTEVVVRMTEVCAGHPERWKGGYLLGLIHLERSDAESAVKVLEEVANATPDVTQVRDALDRARSGIGQWERCVRTLEGHTYGVTSVAFRPDGRYALSGSDDKTLRLWYLDWDYEFPDPVDWDKGARLYLKTFLTLHTPVGPDGFSRTGKPTWNEDDFQQLIQKLQYAGYGWLRPEGVRKELESMASGWQGPPGL